MDNPGNGRRIIRDHLGAELVIDEIYAINLQGPVTRSVPYRFKMLLRGMLHFSRIDDEVSLTLNHFAASKFRFTRLDRGLREVTPACDATIGCC